MAVLSDDWVTCPNCNVDLLADELCDCDHETGPVCLYRCCERMHPAGRKPWEVTAA